MSKHLSKSEIERYRAQGYCAPITVMTPDQAAEYLERLDRAVAAHPEDAAPILQMKSHLVRGRDAAGHFTSEPRPEAEFDRAALARYGDICANSAKFLFEKIG